MLEAVGCPATGPGGCPLGERCITRHVRRASSRRLWRTAPFGRTNESGGDPKVSAAPRAALQLSSLLVVAGGRDVLAAEVVAIREAVAVVVDPVRAERERPLASADRDALDLAAEVFAVDEADVIDNPRAIFVGGGRRVKQKKRAGRFCVSEAAKPSPPA